MPHNNSTLMLEQKRYVFTSTENLLVISMSLRLLYNTKSEEFLSYYSLLGMQQSILHVVLETGLPFNWVKFPSNSTKIYLLRDWLES